MRPIHLTVPPPRKTLAHPPSNFVRQPAIDHERDRAEGSRSLLAALVVCAGVGVAVFALLQARETRIVYVPVPMENVAPPAPLSPSAPRRPVAVEGVVSSDPGSVPPPSRIVITAPAMPMTSLPVVAAMPTPVDYAARDREIADLKRRIDELDETVRRVRADPHWFGLIKGSTNTSRQQSSDAYLNWLDRQRDDLRRRKWALEGR